VVVSGGLIVVSSGGASLDATVSSGTLSIRSVTPAHSW
jgi:autotransporter passenger strand-loop-strand repeat protein